MPGEYSAMNTKSHLRQCIVWLLLGLLSGPAAIAATEHAYEAASTDYFRDQDTLPSAYLQYRQSEEGLNALWGTGPGVGKIKRASFNADAHENVNY